VCAFVELETWIPADVCIMHTSCYLLSQVLCMVCSINHMGARKQPCALRHMLQFRQLAPGQDFLAVSPPERGGQAKIDATWPCIIPGRHRRLIRGKKRRSTKQTSLGRLDILPEMGTLKNCRHEVLQQRDDIVLSDERVHDEERFMVSGLD
jgi:hypothetical protein